MKKIRKIVVLALALSLNVTNISCKKSINDLEKAVSGFGSLNDADTIIEFNNNFIDSYRKTSNRIESILKYAGEAYLKAQGKSNYMMPEVLTNTDYSFGKITKISSGFGDEKATLEKEFKNYSEKRALIDKKFEELQSYMKAEDYKDDKGAKAGVLLNEIEEHSNSLMTSAENILVKIKPIAEEAEKMTLKNDPLKEYIFSSKKMMDTLDVLINEVDRQHTSGRFNEAEAQKKYNELAKALEVNSKLEFKVKDQQYAHKKMLLDSLNEMTKIFLEVYKNYITNAKSSGKISDENANMVYSAYDQVINA
ncbi:hypothetical protein, partial [Chryseobacterium sp.]|uniref:DUF6845 domain-containing protein n=1 Tax=Chryseobacterium sp. TaxID=1871047 RepID=UPI0025BA5679